MILRISGEALEVTLDDLDVPLLDRADRVRVRALVRRRVELEPGELRRILEPLRHEVAERLQLLGDAAAIFVNGVRILAELGGAASPSSPAAARA
jgi:hypothetical protein